MQDISAQLITILNETRMSQKAATATHVSTEGPKGASQRTLTKTRDSNLTSVNLIL